VEKTIDLLKFGCGYLANERIANPLGECEVLLSQILNCSRTELYLNNLTLGKNRLRQYRDLLVERARGLPLQYLVGSAEFMGLEFKVSAGVFIPRPETEILVETAINLANHQKPCKLAILDIGTGCGNIAISLAKCLDRGRIFACDVSESALQLTQENARLNNVNIFLVKSNLLSVFRQQDYFSLIISNPPYISTSAISSLPRELQYEPRRSYDGGADGLSYYGRIIDEAPIYLQSGGKLCLEIGDDQRSAVEEIIVQGQRLSLNRVVRDYNGIDRVIVAQKMA
jgi:release factor glutamine methyltransferase